MNQSYLKYSLIWTLDLDPGSGPWLVPGIAPPGTHPVPTQLPHPGYTSAVMAVYAGGARAGRTSKYGRGALIGRSTHFRSTLVAHCDYDRGL